MSATASPPTGTSCPRCGAFVASNQDWCLNCGDAARTRLVPTPNWRLPVAIAAIVAALALLAIALSFVQLTRDDAPVTPTTTAAPATATPPATTAPPATSAPPATTAPPVATTTTPATPGATTKAPGATTTAPGQTTTTTP